MHSDSRAAGTHGALHPSSSRGSDGSVRPPEVPAIEAACPAQGGRRWQRGRDQYGGTLIPEPSCRVTLRAICATPRNAPQLPRPGDSVGRPTKGGPGSQLLPQALTLPSGGAAAFPNGVTPALPGLPSEPPAARAEICVL